MPNNAQLTNKQIKLRKLSLSGAVFLVTFLVMIILYKLRGYAPFGDNSLACMDANIDYIDFFCYLKDVVSNGRGLVYSFSKGLGGNMFGVIATGYFSPVNILVLLFEKSEMESFFNIAVAVKIALSALTMSWFLCNRMPGSDRSIIASLAIGYGMCQYNIAQASNIFFLEGSYMLPLFMLGIYYIVEKEKPFTLMFSVAYLVIFSWYMGAINCFFTIVWSVFEYMWYRTKEKAGIKKFLVTLEQLSVAGFGGVLISGIVFFPVIVALRKSSEGALGLQVFKDSNEFFGNILTVISNYHMGSLSYESEVSLFCGSLAIVGCIAFFLSSRFSYIQKCIAGLTLGFVAVSYYWKPLCIIYSMLKYPISFWSRYSYLGIFAITFFAAMFFENYKEERNPVKSITIASLLFALIALLNNNDIEGSDLKWVYAELFCVLVISILICVYPACSGKTPGKVLSFALIGFITFEMSCNAILIMNYFHQPNIQEMFIDYVRQGEKQIDSIKQQDDSYYRISQTRTRNMQEGNLSANYDEAAMLNYWGISSYTSVPDDLPRKFLDRSGYKINGEDLYAVNTTIIPVDSLLGVKYILSDRDMPGLIRMEPEEEQNDKFVYYNPYSLPLAFTMNKNDYKGELNYPVLDSTAGTTSDINPFLYQNDVFAQLTGEKSEVFIPVAYEKKENSTKETDYILTIPEGNYAVYGNLPWESPVEETISVDGDLQTYYAMWLSPSVFYVPAADKKAVVTVAGNNKLSVVSEQFYAADLDKLKDIVSPIKKKAVDDCIIKDGFVEINTASNQDDHLFTSIPYDPLWDITVNGDPVEPELFADTFMMVPLVEGDNHIVFEYRLGGLRAGAAATAAGLLLALAEYFMAHRRQKAKSLGLKHIEQKGREV